MASRFIEFKPMEEFPEKSGFYAVIFEGRIQTAYCNESGQLIVGNWHYNPTSSYFSGWCEQDVGES